MVHCWRAVVSLTGLLAIVPVPSRAAEPDYAGMLLTNESLLKDPPKSCDAATVSLNNLELQQCSAVAFKAADAALNEAFAAAIQHGDAKQDDKLKQGQRLWLALRNAECDWEASQYEGGTFAPVVMGNCLVDITRDRTKTLRRAIAP